MEKMRTTDRLETVLKSAYPEDIDSFLQDNKDVLNMDERPFSTYMRNLISQKGLKQQDLFLTADISEGYGYKLISGEKHTVQRDVIIRLCLAAKMTLTEAQRALKLYGMSELYAKIPRDAVLIIAFNNGIYDIEKVDKLLKEHDMDPLYSCSYD